ncbi:hypothetical protein KC19_1G211000 [Ceratodon purpureus]|uniref:Methyltransferase n=1 Tax=Ceratodon purpureus TaxID=3225 RepID=A0A8T0J9H2_CERPU|nr:hypothetical protein KC19_1G211000 [Ceratodon purpureus]
MAGRQGSLRLRGRGEGNAQGKRLVILAGTMFGILFFLSLQRSSYSGRGVSKESPQVDWTVSRAVVVENDPFVEREKGGGGEEGEKKVSAGGGGEGREEEKEEEKEGGDGKEGVEEVEEEKEEEEKEEGHFEGLVLGDEATNNEEEAVEASEEEAGDEGILQVMPKSFPVCDSRYTELVPCLDRNLNHQMKLKLNLSLMEHYERHCPPTDHRLNCLIPPPPNYKVPIRWPKSRDEIWQANVPHTFLATEKSDQHWMVVKGDKVNFPGGGTHFPDGADKYIAHLAKMLKNKDGNLSSGGKIRTVFDVGCGVASFGAYLLPMDILAMSLAPNDVHQNQIQFALERGIPATLGVLGTMRLPYPSKSFDLAHCSRCRIDWRQRDGVLLLEIDRILRPGGYFVWSSPPVYRDDPAEKQEWAEMVDLVSRMCWTIAAKRDQTVIWAKPLTNECYEKRPKGTWPPLCSIANDADAGWQEPMKICITPVTSPSRPERAVLARWPKRMNTPPSRLKELGFNDKTFIDDTIAWKKRVDLYIQKLREAKQMEDDSFRNVMDMKANFGGFAAALQDMNLPVWVMNVVPISGPSTLKIIYDRGFIGSYHDWCEAYSTYPRTYDLLHAWNVFSDVYNHDCSPIDLLLEMDRLLRPQGVVIIRDKGSFVDEVRKQLNVLHWNLWSVVFDAEKDEISDREEKILIARKRLWQPEDII